MALCKINTNHRSKSLRDKERPFAHIRILIWDLNFDKRRERERESVKKVESNDDELNARIKYEMRRND